MIYHAAAKPIDLADMGRGVLRPYREEARRHDASDSPRPLQVLGLDGVHA
jgi:hypothetical protein